MRSSNKRSRSKSNRNRPSGGNIVNRVFDSSGPEGKVRGTPQQIIDKYNQLTRDAQLSGDRVAAENFAQHAEHYTRMLAEAQREIDQKREQAEQQHRERQQQAVQQRGSDADEQPRVEQPRVEPQPEERAPQEQPAAEVAEEQPQPRPRRTRRPKPVESDVVDFSDGDGSDSNLIETPESKPKRAPSRTRKPRKEPAPEADAAPEPAAEKADDTPRAAE
ncbi:DUF4167 domain-containing protein [Palleronia caenipelagi]|uniref:DUF4167 domain-containing protein n=1 Tax=Palleronia caenipelagi TaxID=2489174 RepID=A0A547Q9E4_9RHOB|nr:DUF4167 domain-containing protein [Palleronia caenipelagi]TRD23003.1 DUF4167 domain-containing protein [Palleronia caenipelagi]